MAMRADFNVVTFNHTFDQPNESETRNFPIEASEIQDDQAYLLVQTQGVGPSAHGIVINGNDVSDSLTPDLPPAPGKSQSWLLWMLEFPASFLNTGSNRIMIEKRGSDNFKIGNVVVHWREIV